MIRRLLILASACGLLAACSGLPDLDRGRAALKSGDVAGAERDLHPLATMGYRDARLQLARTHGKSETPEELREAAYWYGTIIDQDPGVGLSMARVLTRLGDVQSMARAVELLRAADARGDERALDTLIAIYTDFPELDTSRTAPQLVERAARLDSVEAQLAVIRWYRHNSADPRYAGELIARCTRMRQQIPECYIDLARHFRATGQAAPLKNIIAESLKGFDAGAVPSPVMERVGWSLVSDDVAGVADPGTAYTILNRVAKDSPQGQVKLARLLVAYPFVDPTGRPEPLLLDAVASGDADAALGLGRLYLGGNTVAADPQKAVKYLEQASTTLPAAHYDLGRIYLRGVLGAPDPVKAAQHLLTAARAGYAAGDVALAQMYSENRGVRPNLANAFVFASLAAGNAVPQGQELLNQLQASMTPQQVQEGQRQLAAELAVRRQALMTADSTPRPAPKTESAP